MEKLKTSCIEWLESIVIALTVVIILYTFFFRTFTVDGPSMENTLMNKDVMAVQCINSSLEYGDIVIIDSLSEHLKPLIKRVIGLEGDTIDIDHETGIVYRNGEALQENYTTTPTYARDGGLKFPITIGDGQVFVLGDNRGISKDSRSADVGLIDERNIWGTVLFRVAPFNKIGAV